MTAHPNSHQLVVAALSCIDPASPPDTTSSGGSAPVGDCPGSHILSVVPILSSLSPHSRRRRLPCNSRAGCVVLLDGANTTSRDVGGTRGVADRRPSGIQAAR